MSPLNILWSYKMHINYNQMQHLNSVKENENIGDLEK